MYTKEMIKQAIDILDLEAADYLLYSGNSLVMHGIRETATDLDIGVTPEIFARISKGEVIEEAKWTGQRMFKAHSTIEFFEVPNLDETPSRMIDGVRVQSLMSVVAWKQQYGTREKDIEDLRRILGEA